MSILALRILPPFAIGRFGSAAEPMDNYTIEVDPEHPLDFRTIKGAETLIVDDASGEISGSRIPSTVAFKQGGRIRPVAPFLEVFAQTDSDPSKPLAPLTVGLLAEHGLGEEHVQWRVSVANRKVVRRTNNEDDLVEAKIDWFSTHEPKTLQGHCNNFIAADRFINFGRVLYIKPNEGYPEIRLRFTPAPGVIYGPEVEKNADPKLYQVPSDRQIYDKAKGSDGNKGWYRFDPRNRKPFYNETMPASLYAIMPPAPPWLNHDIAISRGFLDDACDGLVDVGLTLKDGTRLEASARVCSAPPIVVPDSLFVRTLADDLEQIIEGPNIEKPQIGTDEWYELMRAKAEDIVRRAYETVRYLNVAVMNGNSPEGRDPLGFDTMPASEAMDTERMEWPVMVPETVDTLAILALHQQVFAALRSGAAPWFLRLMRLPHEVADFTAEGRRKMPALMCGADGNYLALTHRQIDAIRAASDAMPYSSGLQSGSNGDLSPDDAPALTPRNRTALVNYAAAGNPVSSRPINAVANCCPGLEVDFRGVWRRIFEGLVMREYDNLVIEVDPEPDDPAKLNLKGHRLLRVNGVKVMAQAIGPSMLDRFDSVVLNTEENPDAVQPLEWSNGLASILHSYAGQTVTCDFTKNEVWDDQVWWKGDDTPHVTYKFRLRPFFDGETAVISPELAHPGELTQGLCSPWQNDYRECSCYYWAAARPDYVNVEPSSDGVSRGDNWLQKEHTGRYVPDDYVDLRMISYDDLFGNWEKWLRIVIRGRDVSDTPEGEL